MRIMEEIVELRIHPWRRYFARSFDMVIFGLFVGGILAFTPFYFTLLAQNIIVQTAIMSMLPMLLWTFVEALIVSNFGTTLGKKLLGIRILTNTGEKPNYVTALKRAFGVYVNGMYLGVPLLSIFGLFSSMDYLSTNGITKWDKVENLKIIHNEPNLIGKIIIGLVLIGAYAMNVIGSALTDGF